MIFTRRYFNKCALALFSTLPGLFRVSDAAEKSAISPEIPQENTIPLILDTDIGDDLDDTWALMMLLRSTEIDVKLITTDFGNTRYRSRLLAKLLQTLGHTDIPIGIGLDPADNPGNQSEWLGDYRLEDYPGTVYQDGVQAMIESIKQSPEPVTLLCIGPVTNIAEALRRDPSIAENARFVGMQGSVRIGYDGESKQAVEWNVKMDPLALQAVFAAPWDCSITPLDSCGLVRLQGENYQKVYRSEDTWMKTLIENYTLWLPRASWLVPKPDLTRMSSTLFDTVAVYMAHAQDLLVMEDLPLRVTDDAYTVIDEENGRIVHCATGWKNLPVFEERLVQVITGSG